MRLSGLQKEVVSLYRKCFREARKKPADVRENFRNYARYLDQCTENEFEAM